MRFAALILLALVAACGSRQLSDTDSKKPVAEALPEDVARAIEGAVEQYRQSYEVQSMEGLASLYARDLDLVVVFQGHAYRGWTQVEEFLTKRLAGATKVRMAINDLGTLRLGPTAALANCRLEMTIGDDASTVSERGSLTLVFRKIDESWMVVAEHFSYPTGPS